MSACTRYPDEDQILRYVIQDLAEADQTAFEDHLFGCDACLGRVERYQAAQQALARRTLPPVPMIVPSAPLGARGATTRAVPRWLLGAAAASLAVAAGLWSWQHSAAPSVEQGAWTAAPAQSPSNVRTEAALQVAVLAMVTPPPYLSVTTRGAADADARFAEAMQAYTRADWVAAARGLTGIDTAEARFYQGIADLMRGDAASATTTLERARATGVQPYARESLFYLGKAALLRGDVRQAREALAASRAANAGTSREAARLLEALDELVPGP